MDDVNDSAAGRINRCASIWRQPRATFQQIVGTDPEKHVVAFAALTAVVQTLNETSERDLGDRFGLVAIQALALVNLVNVFAT